MLYESLCPLDPITSLQISYHGSWGQKFHHTTPHHLFPGSEVTGSVERMGHHFISCINTNYMVF